MLNEISQTQNIDRAVSCHVCKLILELRNLDYIVFKIHICVYIFIYDIKAFEKVIGQNKKINRERSGNKRGQ